MPTQKETAFKRLAIGTTFTCRLGKFRKATDSHVFPINEKGRGQTHLKKEFAGSTWCKPV